MRTDLAPPKQNQGGFVRWSASDGSVLTITYGSWLVFIPVLFLAIGGLFCFALPVLAITMPMPGHSVPTYSEGLSFLVLWMFGALILYVMFSVLRTSQPSRLILDFASCRYLFRQDFKPNVKVYSGEFSDIQKVYIWKRREGSIYLYNVIISLTPKGVATSLWTYSTTTSNDQKPENWAKEFCEEIGIPFGGVLEGKFKKTWRHT